MLNSSSIFTFPSCLNFKTAIAVNVLETEAICMGEFSEIVSIPGKWPVPMYFSKTIFPDLATRMPPLKSFIFKTVSYQSWQLFFILISSAAETGPAAGSFIIAILSALALSEVCKELQDTLHKMLHIKPRQKRSGHL